VPALRGEPSPGLQPGNGSPRIRSGSGGRTSYDPVGLDPAVHRQRVVSAAWTELRRSLGSSANGGAAEGRAGRGSRRWADRRRRGGKRMETMRIGSRGRGWTPFPRSAARAGWPRRALHG